MMGCYFCVSAWQNLSPAGIIASNLLFQQTCVFCLWQKARGSSWELQVSFQVLQHCHSECCCGHSTTGQGQGGWQCWGNALRMSTKQSPRAALWKPGGCGWNPKTPRRNLSWVCSIVGNFKIQGLMAPLCALLCGSGQSDQLWAWNQIVVIVSGLRKLQSSSLLSSRVE